MDYQFWMVLPLYIICFIAIYLLALYIGLHLKVLENRDNHLIAFCTISALVGTLLISYLVP